MPGPPATGLPARVRRLVRRLLWGDTAHLPRGPSVVDRLVASRTAPPAPFDCGWCDTGRHAMCTGVAVLPRATGLTMRPVGVTACACSARRHGPGPARRRPTWRSWPDPGPPQRRD